MKRLKDKVDNKILAGAQRIIATQQRGVETPAVKPSLISSKSHSMR